jgi:hypothetical protein
MKHTNTPFNLTQWIAPVNKAQVMSSIKNKPDIQDDPEQPTDAMFSLSRQQSIVMDILRKLIENQAVDHTDADGKRWWHVNARVVSLNVP